MLSSRNAQANEDAWRVVAASLPRKGIAYRDSHSQEWQLLTDGLEIIFILQFDA